MVHNGLCLPVRVCACVCVIWCSEFTADGGARRVRMLATAPVTGLAGCRLARACLALFEASSIKDAVLTGRFDWPSLQCGASF